MAWSTVHFGIFQLQGWLGCCITGSDKATGRRPGAWDWVVGQAGGGRERRREGWRWEKHLVPSQVHLHRAATAAEGSIPTRGADQLGDARQRTSLLRTSGSLVLCGLSLLLHMAAVGTSPGLGDRSEAGLRSSTHMG